METGSQRRRQWTSGWNLASSGQRASAGTRLKTAEGRRWLTGYKPESWFNRRLGWLPHREHDPPSPTSRPVWGLSCRHLRVTWPHGHILTTSHEKCLIALSGARLISQAEQSCSFGCLTKIILHWFEMALWLPLLVNVGTGAAVTSLTSFHHARMDHRKRVQNC